MEEQAKQEAKELAGRGARQTRHAARNGVRAAGTAADALGEDIKEGADDVVEAGKRLSPSALGFITSETGLGFLGVTVAIASSVFAANRFKSAIAARKQVIK